MPEYDSSRHRLVDLIRWEPDREAERIDDHILMSRGMSYVYAVTSDDGDVVINTGLPSDGPRHRERFETMLGRRLDVRRIVLTQSHPDHMGGWPAFAGPETEIVAQRELVTLREERARLGPFFAPRQARVIPAAAMPSGQKGEWSRGADALPDPTLFSDTLSFEVGGRRFELYSTPSGETIDALVVWLPAERTLFTGNLMGALQGSLPHFYTPRGDRARSLVRFVRDMKLLLRLKPALLITGHGEPIVGEAVIEETVRKVHDAVLSIHDQTIDGMNAGKDLHALMRDIRLPAHLEHVPGRGRLSWYVRAMWEEFTGWFRQESTTELYEVSQREVWGELVELAGIEPLVERARAHLAAGRPVHALHFTDLVVAIDPHHRGVRTVEIGALEALIDQDRAELFDLQGWLESELARAKEAIGEPPEPQEGLIRREFR